MLTQVKINSIDVTSKIRPYQVFETKDNALTSIKIQALLSIDSLLNLQQLQTFEVWRGDASATEEKIFNGYITKVKSNGQYYEIIASNALYLAVNTVFNQIYDLTSPQAGVVSEIFKDVVNTYTGLTADSTSVQNSGTVNILEKFVVRRSSAFDMMKKLIDALGWQMYYRADTNLTYAEPPGQTVNSNTLTIGGNVINIPTWNEDTSEFANDIFCYGEATFVGYSDEFTGDGSTATFVLTKGKPSNVSVTVDGVVKKGGVTTSTSGAEYTVDAEAKTITFTTGNIPTGGQAIVVSYDYAASIVAHEKSQASIDQYGQTVQKVFQFPEIKTLADLEQKTKNLLPKISQPFLSAKLKIKSSLAISLGLRVGQRIRVVDNISKVNGANIDREFVILNRTLRFPGDYDEIEVGDREWKLSDWEAGIEERLHKLFDEAMQSEDILLEIQEFSRIFTSKRKTLTLTRYYINDSFILDHDINGIMYNASETDIYDDFESAATWSPLTGTLTSASNDNDSSHYWVGTQGVNFGFSGAGAGSATGIITTTKNLTAITGVTTGTPTQGTLAIWAWTSDNPLSGMSIRLGSSAANRIQVTGQTFAQRLGASGSFSLNNSDRTYILFDLDSPASVTGTPAWSNATYCLLIPTATKAGNVTLDYLTLSKNNSLGLNGLGDRTTIRHVSSTVY